MKGAASYGNEKQGFTRRLHLLTVQGRHRAQHGDGKAVQPLCRRLRVRAPHLWLPQFLSEETERELAISMDLLLLERCDELWVCGDEISEGMAREIARAEQVGIPTRYITEEDIYVRD